MVHANVPEDGPENIAKKNARRVHMVSTVQKYADVKMEIAMLQLVNAIVILDGWDLCKYLFLLCFPRNLVVANLQNTEF